jgi:hypothetical protein
MTINFGYINNTRIEEVMFEIVDMEFPYNAIIRTGALNAFEAVSHSAYLCTKIPSNQSIISVYRSQEAAEGPKEACKNPRSSTILMRPKLNLKH